MEIMNTLKVLFVRVRGPFGMEGVWGKEEG